MKHFNFYLITVLTIGLAFTSCQKENNEISRAGMVPLKTGNSWTYQVYRSDIAVDTFILRVGDYININGNKGFRLTDNSSDETFLADNDDSGNFMSIGGYSNKDTLFEPSMCYKKNAIKGDSWDYKEISYMDDSYFEKFDVQMYCINSDTLINTPKGDFKCKAFKWSPDNNEDVFIDYVSENTGIIKSEHFEDNKLFGYNILIDYKIEK